MAAGGTTDPKVREAAIRSIKRKRAFRNSLAIYIIINAFLVGIWAIDGTDEYFWPGWVLAGWGVAILFQAWSAYGKSPKTISEDEIQREAQKLE
jgi:hypothetical protein